MFSGLLMEVNTSLHNMSQKVIYYLVLRILMSAIICRLPLVSFKSQALNHLQLQIYQSVY